MPTYGLVLHLKKLFALLQVDLVLDVGANIGQFYDFLRQQVGYDGRVISFEPIQAHVDALRGRAQHSPNWAIEGYALGATEGTAKLNVMKESVFSSFLAPDNLQVAAYATQNQVVRQEIVAVRTLDRVFDDIERQYASRSVYLKLDTQGFDLEVLRGAPRTLQRVTALQTEASVRPLYVNMPSCYTSIAAFENAGFALSGMFPVTLDDRLRLIEFDCVMVRRDVASENTRSLSRGVGGGRNLAGEIAEAAEAVNDDLTRG